MRSLQITGVIPFTTPPQSFNCLPNNSLLAGQAGRFFGGDSYRLSQCRFVTTNHWDIDSFLAVWAFCNRSMALAHESGELAGFAACNRRCEEC